MLAWAIPVSKLAVAGRHRAIPSASLDKDVAYLIFGMTYFTETAYFLQDYSENNSASLRLALY